MKPYTRPKPRQTQRPRGLLRRLTLAEWLTFAASVASVAVAIASLAVSWRSAEDARANTDVRRAIANLSKLASQTKRQADYSAQQVAILQAQARDAKDQTRAIAAQTEAITGSSAATIRAADAQRVVSLDAANASRPRFTLRQLDVDDLRQDVSNVDAPKLSIRFTFKNTGVSPATIKQVRFRIAFGASRTIEGQPQIVINGNDVVVTSSIDSGLSPTRPVDLTIPKAIFAAFRDGAANMLFSGEIDFVDVGGAFHTQCFSYSAVHPSADQAVAFSPADVAGLKCA